MRQFDDSTYLGNKSLNLRYTSYREKSRDKNPKQIQASVKQLNIFSSIVHANNFNLFRSPHQNYERNQILQIESRKLQPEQKTQEFQCDNQFLNRCKSGTQKIDLQLCVKASQQKIIKPSNGETSYKQSMESLYINLGRNIIRINQSVRYRKIQNHFQCDNYEQDDLLIRGDFQGGNLFKHFNTKQNQYIIILNNDTNTHGYNQWFHLFLMLKQKNSPSNGNRPINFIIANITKQIRFIDGMKLLTRKYKKQLRNYGQWQRNLPFQFFQSNIVRENGLKCYSVGFSLYPKDIQDGLFVALSFPYPFSRIEYLAEEMASVNSQFSAIKIGKSKLGNPIVVFRLLSQRTLKNSKNIFILSRQHASETSSSYICQFIIKRLTLFNSYLRLLADINWHIIPILNPDGVIHGNSRTSINGYDINRCWAHYLLSRSPEVQCVNNYLTKIGVTPGDIFLDLHTHTRELGCFSYFNQANQFCRTFNSKMSELTPSYDTSKCRVGYDLSKKNTFRVQMRNRFKIQNILTFQASYYGYICQQTQQLHQYTVHDYQVMADGILKSIQHYLKIDEQAFKLNLNNEINSNFSQIKTNANIQSQSDTDPEGDYLNQDERKQVENYEETDSKIKQVSTCYNDFSNLYEKNKPRAALHSNRKLIENDRKKVVSEPKIINIYEISNQTSKYNFGSTLYKTGRAISARLKIFEEKKNNISQQHQRHQQKTNNKNFIDKPNSKTKSLNKTKYDQSYYNRQSFKSLFASAQMRNVNSFSERKFDFDQGQSISENSDLNKSSRRLAIKKQKLDLQIKTKISNINFPLKIRNQEQQKLLKTLQINVYKRKKPKSTRFTQGQKRANDINDNTINEKIAQLCALAKNIQKLTNFS